MKKLLVIMVAVAMAACCGTQKPVSTTTLFDATAFDTVLNGQSVSLYTLTNGSGMAAQITNYGARLVDLWVPAADSTFKDVVWGYESIAAYLASTDKFCGPIVGRYGNRIGKGAFELDGKKYTLTLNDGLNHLHGGVEGLSTKVWNAREYTDSVGNMAVEMTYLSVDGDQGYPGNVEIKAVYTLNQNNELSIDYTATTDAPTVINLTSHAYFNLHGTSAEPSTSHILSINADSFTPTDSGLIPTGEIASVEGTPLDFRQPMQIGARLDTLTYEPMIFGKGYDHNWVLNKAQAGVVTLAAEVYEPKTGIVMTVYTDQPAIQFYSGNFMDGVDVGKRGDKHNFRTGVALETQNYPDAPNHSNFPNSVLRPGETYTHRVVYGFSVR